MLGGEVMRPEDKAAIILKNRNLEIGEKILMLYILFVSKKEVSPRAEMAKDLHIHNSTFSKYLKKLESKNLVAKVRCRKHGCFSANNYILVERD